MSDTHTLDLCCGGKRKCPVLREDSEGFLIEDKEQSADPIRLTREQAERVASWLAERLACSQP